MSIKRRHSICAQLSVIKAVKGRTVKSIRFVTRVLILLLLVGETGSVVESYGAEKGALERGVQNNRFVYVENQVVPIIRSKDMNINYQVDESKENLSQVELWYAKGMDGGWQLYDYDGDVISPIKFVAPGEGVYRFLVVAVDKKGRRSCGGGELGATKGVMPVEIEGQQIAFVDYTVPQLYMRSPLAKQTKVETGTLKISWVGFDENLGPEPVRLYYMEKGQEGKNWKVIGPAQGAAGEYVWELPKDLSGTIKIAAVLSDRAGHQDVKRSEWMEIEKEQGKKSSTTQEKTNKEIKRILPATEGMGEMMKKEEVQRGNGQAQVKPELRQQAENYLSQGNLYYQRSEWDKASQSYWKALALDQEFLEARLRLGDTLYNLNQYGRAKVQFEFSLSIEPESVSGLYGLARCEMAEKQYGQAQKTLERLLRKECRDGQGWLLYGDVCQKMGEKEKAVNSWQRAVQVGSDVIGKTAKERLDKF